MNDNKLSYDVVIERISTGVYDVEHSKPKTLLKDTDFIDENKSVKWNKEQIALENEKIKLHNEAIKEAKKNGPLKFEDDLKEAIMNEHGLNATQVGEVYWRAYESGHSAGMKEIFWAAQDLSDLAVVILKFA